MKRFRLVSFLCTQSEQVKCSVLTIAVHCSFICLWLCIGSVNTNELTRLLTVRFSSRGISRLEHEEILECLDDYIDPLL